MLLYSRFQSTIEEDLFEMNEIYWIYFHRNEIEPHLQFNESIIDEHVKD